MSKSVMQGLLRSTCLVFLVLQQHMCYSSPIQNQHDMNKEVTKTQEKEHVIVGQKLETTDRSPITENTDKMSDKSTTSNQSSTNQLELTMTKEMADSHKETNIGTVGYTYENADTANNIKKLSQVDEKNESVITGTEREMGLTDKFMSESIQNKELVDILTTICSEQYKPCMQETSGLKTFKKISACRPCSCNPEECHISKNCCPDVEMDHTATKKDNTQSHPVCTSLSDELMVRKLELATSRYHKINNFAKPASGFIAIDQEKINSKEDKEVQSISKLLNGNTSKDITEAATPGQITPPFVNDYLEFSHVGKKPNETFEKLNKNVQVSNDTDNKVLDNKTVNAIKNQIKNERIYGKKEAEVLKREENKENTSLIAGTPDNKQLTKGINEIPPEFKERVSSSNLAKTVFPMYLVTDSSSNLAKTVFPMYLVTVSCPSHYHDKDIIAKCENKAPSRLLDNIPVYNWFTTKIYRNKWCAQCHNISFLEYWSLVTDCLQLYQMDYLPLMITDFHELAKNCTVRIVPQTNQRTEANICQTFSNSTTSNVVEKCNVTGLWKENNTAIYKLCTEKNYMPHYEDRLMAQTTLYKNIFCYICNTFGDLNISRNSTHEEEISPDSEYGDRRLNFEVSIADPNTLAQTWSTDNDHEITCPHGHILDVYSEDCIQFECPMYQRAMANVCLNRDRDVTGLVVASVIHIEFQKPVYIGETLDKMSKSGHQIIQTIDAQMQISKSGCDIRYVKMYANFIQSKEGYIQQLFLLSKLANTKKCSVKQVVFFYNKLSAGQINVTIQLNKTGHVENSTSQKTKLFARLSFNPIHNHALEVILIQKPVFHEIWLKENFYCPRVLMTLSEFTRLVQQGSFKSIEDKNLASVNQTGLVPICYSKYLRPWLLTLYKTNVEKPTEQTSIAGALGLISTGMSMISTVLVLITYSIFSELRFIPGKLLMVLSFNILLAEGFYSFGIELEAGSIWCKLVGICIHLFWVATMFCMSSNLWLILRNIKDPLEPENRAIIQSKSNYQVFKYSCYCYTMAALCVLSNIVLSRSIYHDDNYGYGSKLCYINSTKMKILTFILPIALVLVINFFMFCHIMISISKGVQNKYSMVMKAKVTVFLKLSTITGFYWAFGFIYEATQIKAFEFLFIVFNGGQGFFLMWSFLLNRRVFELYKNAYQNFFSLNKTKFYKRIVQKFWMKFKDKPETITTSSC